MAINLTQTDRTATSVTFDVDGITDDRQTFIWIPDPLIDGGDWLTLSDAYSLDFIQSYSTSGGVNGTITVNFYASDTLEFKVWEFFVCNYVGGSPTDTSEVLDTILKFEWDNEATKYTGDDFDVTVSDLIRLNNFSSYMNAWIAFGDGLYYDLEGIESGDDFWNGYFLLPAQNIYDTADYLSSSTLSTRSAILALVGDVINNTATGEMCYASDFNAIKAAINSFNLSV